MTAYFQKHAAFEAERQEVVQLAAGMCSVASDAADSSTIITTVFIYDRTTEEGLHTATLLVQQKQQQARIQERQARAATAAGPSQADIQVSDQSCALRTCTKPFTQATL